MNKTDILHFINKIKESKAKKLDLSNRGITELPNEIGELTWITSIDISYNNIRELPASIIQLQNLKTLLLVRNNISRLPNGIGQLKNLRTLDVSYNPLVKLPKEIGFLSHLEFLDASFCELRTLPLELTNLFGIKKLNLEENPLQFPPLKVVKRGLYATMHYLTIEKRKSEASRVMIQVFNMPEKIQASFNEYIQYFNQMVSKANNKEVIFNTNFVNQDFYQEMDLNAGVDGYLHDVIRYIQEKVQLLGKQADKEVVHQAYFESRMLQVREQLMRFNTSLDNKIDEIKAMKNELKDLYDFMDDKME